MYSPTGSKSHCFFAFAGAGKLLPWIHYQSNLILRSTESLFHINAIVNIFQRSIYNIYLTYNNGTTSIVINFFCCCWESRFEFVSVSSVNSACSTPRWRRRKLRLAYIIWLVNCKVLDVIIRVYAYTLAYPTVQINYTLLSNSQYNADLGSDRPTYDFYSTVGLLTR